MVELREGSALLHLVRSGPGSEPRGPRQPVSAGTGEVGAGAGEAGDGPGVSSAGAGAGEGPEPATCGFCGSQFVEDPTQATCQACPLHKKGCGLMRCPHCGYENAKEPGWLSWIKERIA